jgi:hypothetical protein
MRQSSSIPVIPGIRSFATNSATGGRCSETLEDSETAIRAKRREEAEVATVAVRQVPGQPCQRTLIVVDQDAGR